MTRQVLLINFKKYVFHEFYVTLRTFPDTWTHERTASPPLLGTLEGLLKQLMYNR